MVLAEDSHQRKKGKSVKNQPRIDSNLIQKNRNKTKNSIEWMVIMDPGGWLTIRFYSHWLITHRHQIKILQNRFWKIFFSLSLWVDVITTYKTHICTSFQKNCTWAFLVEKDRETTNLMMMIIEIHSNDYRPEKTKQNNPLFIFTNIRWWLVWWLFDFVVTFGSWCSMDIMQRKSNNRIKKRKRNQHSNIFKKKTHR